METELLEIVEVSRTERVYCQHQGCNRPIFRKIHVIRHHGAITFVGSGCFRQHYLHFCNHTKSSERSNNSSINLSPEEVQLLLHNTERLLELIQERYKPAPELHQKSTLIPAGATDEEIWQIALEETKRHFRTERKIDPELPGWKGWVNLEAKKLFNQLKNGGS